MGNVIVSNITRTPVSNGSNWGSVAGAAPSNVYPLSISLTTAGRAGFYMDYSELSAAGTHKFYICRTHGTTGAVGATYTTSGDDHTVVCHRWRELDVSVAG